ncbi:MAG TPA: hypothetical protein VHD56_17265 [Tepidisphaeraceae bacterium]|nr:hypothetical protein [Tepidisphaeraceae bacterium]
MISFAAQAIPSPSNLREGQGEGRFVFLILLALVSGCTTHVIPPSNPTLPVTVYLTDYGKHSSLLLPSNSGGYDEYAFGDWDYFALGHTNLFVTIRAMISSPQASFGRRHVDAQPSELQQKIGAKRLMQFDVSREKADSLSHSLDARFHRATTQPFYSDYSQLYQVRDPKHYWVLHNCNNETADWLRKLDCRIDGTALFSSFLVTQQK